jgi:dipeptidyl aminopeptidase/acylaminoacyl peptidase
VITVGWKLCIPGTASNEAVTNEGGVSVTTPLAGLGSEYLNDNRTVDGAIGELPTFSLRVDPDGVHPMTIAYLRKQSYAGSPLTLEQILQPGSNYNRSIVSYRSEGLKVYALLTVPLGQRPATGWPVVIFNHGYIPPEEYSTTERYEAYLDGFAANGYIVLRPDLRGHGNSEGVANGAYGHPDYTIDVLNAVASIKQLGEADANRIGMWGHSMGGYLTLRAMVVSPDIKAGVIWSGVVASYEDLLNIWTMGADIGLIPEGVRRWGTQLLAEVGTPEENPSFWSSISANSYVADLSGPLQLHHGSGDLVVPLAFSNLLVDDIDSAEGAVEYYVYPNDDHSLTASFPTAMARSLAFFDAHVKNAPSSQ